jgi:hypothetical protein
MQPPDEAPVFVRAVVQRPATIERKPTMANYYATARSNYFAVKDDDAFKSWCANNDFDVWQGSDENAARFAIAPGDGWDSGGWPELRDDDGEPTKELCEALAQYLAEGEVAVLLEVGHEKRRYLIGSATAVHSSGKRIDFTLDDIYTRARKAFGGEAVITEANY